VLFQKAVEERSAVGKADRVFFKTVKVMAPVSLVVFAFVFFFVEDIIALLFGDNWRIAGRYAKILSVLFFVRFIASSMSVINIAFEKNKISLLWQVGLLLLTVAVCSLSYFYGLSMVSFLSIYAVVASLYYTLLLYVVYLVASARI
jgi:O-antigen/teichoic acid export membrane protein